MKTPLCILALALVLSGCEASLQSTDDSSVPTLPPPHYDGNTATLCSWAHGAGFPFDGGRTQMEQTIYDAYSDSGNRATGTLKIYLDCDSGQTALEWNIDADGNDSFDSSHTQYKMDMPIGGEDGAFSLSGSTQDYKSQSGYNCTESQDGTGVSRLELAQQDMSDPDLMHLTVHVSGTINDTTQCDGAGGQSMVRTFDTAYRIDLNRVGERFGCQSAQYDPNSQAVDRVCRGHYN